MGDAPSHPELLDWLASELMSFGLAAQAVASADRAVADLPVVVGFRLRRRPSSTRATRCSGDGGRGGSRPRSSATRSWR